MESSKEEEEGEADIKRSRRVSAFDTAVMNLKAFSAILSFIYLTRVDASGQEGSLNVLYKTFEKCNTKNELGTCIRLKALKMLDNVLITDSPIVVNDYLTITKDKQHDGNETARSETDIESQLPFEQDKKDIKLDEMIADKLLTFLQSRSLQFTIPADVIEGRGKKGKKGGMMMMAAMAVGGMMVQMAMGKIGMLAGKALLVAKMALLLSGIIALKKLIGSGGGGGDSHPQVVYAESHGSGGGHGGGWGRSAIVPDENGTHQMAYHAQARSL